MTPTKEITKIWLTEIDKNREWLANECGAAEGTINNWLSPSGPFPSIAIVKLQELMEKYPSPITQAPKQEILEPSRIQEEDTEQEIILTFTDTEWEIVEKFTRVFPNINLSEYARGKVFELCAGMSDPTETTTPNDDDDDDYYLPVLDTIYIDWPGTKIDDTEDKDDDYVLPVIGNIAAGGLIAGDTIPWKVKPQKKYPSDYFGLRVCGNSMEPLVSNDQIAVIRPWDDPDMPDVGDIVVYSDGRGVTLKQLALRDGKYVLSSLNPLYKDITPIDGEGRITGIYVDKLDDFRKA